MGEKNYHLKLKVAKYYYEEDLTQQQIAERFNVSRPTVSKLLKQAREDGIVQIKVIDVKDKGDLVELEEQLENIYQLEEVRIADCGIGKTVKECIGKKAASYFEQILINGLKVGLSWGTTLKAMVDNLSENKQIKDLEVVTLVGGSGDLDSEVHSNILAGEILNKYNGRGYYLYAPAIVDDKEVCQALIKNQETKKILKKAREVEVAFVGIGAPIESSNLLETGYFEKKEIEEMKEHGAVGDICSRFFDKSGDICDLKLNYRAIGIALSDLKQIPKVVGVAGGEEKVDSIKAAMKGGFIDVLITDKFTAEAIKDKKYS